MERTRLSFRSSCTSNSLHRGNVLTVNFVNPLADLTVKVTDNKTGKVVYEECISASAPQSKSVILNAENGDYTLSFTHELGYLTGEFAIR